MWGVRCLKQAASVLEFALNISRRHQAEVADPDKAMGQYMKEEPPDKLLGSQSDEPVGAGVLVIPGTEGNRLTIKGEEPLVGDGHPVGVMAQVAEDMPRPAEGRFGIDDPLGSSEFSDPPFEDRWVSPAGDLTEEAHLSLFEDPLQAVEELPADHFCQSADRDQEVVLGWDPSVTFEAYASGRDHHMQVGVERKFLGPSVKDGREAGQCTEALPTLGQFDEPFRGGMEQEVIQESAVL